jgi:hypothetical protein
MIKVFLGGTCNESNWRSVLIDFLKIDYFNPVVDDWTPECMEEEIKQREECDYCLYVITPLMAGVYSIAEVVDDSNKRPERTLFCVVSLETKGNEVLTFTEGQTRSLEQVKKMVGNNGARVFETLSGVATFLNNAGSVHK